MTTGIGTAQCRSFRRKFFTKFFPVCFEVAHEYLRISEERDHVQANRFLNQLDNHLRIHELNLTEGRERLKTFASKMASSCQRIVNQHDETDAIKLCSELFARYQLAAPNDTDVVGFFEKAACERFWFQKIKRKAAQTVEHVRRLCGVVNKKRGIYCSDDALRRWQIDKALSAQFMEQTFLESSEGDHLSLAEIAAKNVSNPVIRRCEMMVRIRGFEEVAMHYGHVGDFYTITVPSKMHSHNVRGEKNPKYDGTTTKQANDYLCDLWKCIRAKLDREDLRLYGIRVTEPHHDAAPHWHLLLFMHPDDRMAIRSIIQSYAIREDGNEPGAAEHRFKCVEIDPHKGDAAGYVAKYIAKNIDGEFVDLDTYGEDAKTSAKRITAWTNINGIRQFQFIGGPSVTLWRELRKLPESDQEDLEQFRQTADASDWAAYVLAMGGTSLPRSDRPLKLEYATPMQEQIDFETGEVSQMISERTASPKVAGLRLHLRFIPINKKQWTLKASPPGRSLAAALLGRQPES